MPDPFTRLETLLGPGRVHRAPLEPRANVGMFRTRDLAGLIRPGDVDGVRATVRAFAGHHPLHAVSTGRNWGLGSREPAADGAVLLDLSGLDRVRALDTAAGWAVIEPGVTQLRLAGLLTGTGRVLNVTASSGHTSVLGNAVDRGVGLRRQRTADLAGLEAVLADGTLARFGWWPGERPTVPYPHGLGPSPLHLFTQSSLGVVTAAAITLAPRPEAQRVLRIAFARGDLAKAVDELRRWTAQGLVSGVLKIYDTVSTRSYGGRQGDYLALVCVEGTSRAVEALTGVLLAEAADSGLFGAITRSDTDPAAPDDAVLRVVEAAYAGDPSRNEEMLRSAVGQPADRVDSDGGGWLFFLPLIPFTGHDVAAAQDLLDVIHTRTGVRAGCTVNALDADVVDFVVSIRFPREEAAAAHAALDLAHELFDGAGYRPYRLDADHAAWIDRAAPDPAALAFVRGLKRFADPAGVFAPGRYA
ncbi:hypothetical protein Afil01_33920 [Actinorhabdospora filicis]|uniref:FAD-binding PCMH-type domain-containing protein n=1 Tax=Actinorhabdospora filicis TaxID=1785913 RepID=A0A9W6SMF5_9ACTN|nr:FAD-binding protein [Actinorhabdospora filicis]GLZ78585.1 hypothetical protein Afil01_33920 [Actinorhabdospora filicis]